MPVTKKIFHNLQNDLLPDQFPLLRRMLRKGAEGVFYASNTTS